jgi:serine/threonine protein kinase
MTLSNAVPVPEVTPAISRIGRFYITRELGRGSIGTVYLGHDPIIDRAVAIKTFNARLTPFEKKQHEQQFINEARAAGRLSHPNIVTIYDASSEGNTSYIAMEYLQGRELSKLLDKGHQFDADDVASIIWKIADALEYAHRNDVIHRDIKPANIFMITNHQPKVVDFGIARAPNRMSDQPVASDQPYTLFHNNLLGTPNYMSPEQALGQPVDARTDIYSLGAVMYEMLAHRKPFHANDTDQLLQLIAYKAPPAPHAIDPTIPLVLSQIVMKAMSKRPKKRYQHAEEMALDLKRYLTHERRARHQLQKSMRAHQRHTRPQPARPGRSRLFWLIGATVAGVAMIGACIHWLS